MRRAGPAALALAAALTGCTDRAPVAPTPTAAIGVDTVAIDGRPSAVAVVGGLVYVADDERDVVHVFDARTLRSAGEPVVVDDNPVALEPSGDGAVWVAHAGGTLRRVAEGEASEPVEVGGSLVGLSAERDVVWAADIEAGRVVAVTVDGATGDGFEVEDGAVRVEATPGALWVSGTEDRVTRIDPSTGRTRTYEVGTGPIGLAARGDEVWVTGSDEGTVSRLSPAPVTVDVGGGPVAIAITDDGTVWVADQDDATLSIVQDERYIDLVELGLHPRDIATDGHSLFVVGTNREALVRVEP